MLKQTRVRIIYLINISLMQCTHIIINITNVSTAIKTQTIIAIHIIKQTKKHKYHQDKQTLTIKTISLPPKQFTTLPRKIVTK